MRLVSELIAGCPRLSGAPGELLSLLGLGVYGFLIKLATDNQSSAYNYAIRHHKVLAVCGVAAFAICTACALMHGFMSSQCLGYQLLISRYFGRLEGGPLVRTGQEVVSRGDSAPAGGARIVLVRGNHFLLIATFALTVGAGLVALWCDLVLFEM